MKTYIVDDAPPTWQVMSVNDACTRVTSGGTPSRKIADYYGGSIAWIKTKELADSWISETEELITEQALAKSSAKLLPANTILMAMYGATVGKLAILSREMTCNQAACAMLVNSELADYRFIFYHLLNARPQIVDLANGAAQQNLSAATIKGLEFPFPPLAEQRGVAATLGALDDKIESNRRLAGRSAELIDAQAEALLRDRPTRTVALGEVAVFNRSSVRPGASDDPLLYVDIAAVSPGRMDEIQATTWGKAPSRARRAVADGDLIYSTVRPGRRSFCLVIDPDPKTVVSTGFAVMSPLPAIGSSLLATISGSLDFASYLESVAHGSAYPAVSVAAMAKYDVEVPKDPSEAVRFEDMTMPLRRRVHRAELENAKLKGLRDALLPELLAGRMRVPEAAEAVEEAIA